MDARLRRERRVSDAEVDDCLARVGTRVGKELLGRRRTMSVARASQPPELPREPEHDARLAYVLEDDAWKLAAHERSRGVSVRPSEPAKPPERASDG